MMLTVISSIFLLMILIGVPVAFGMGLAGASWILFFENLEPGVIAWRMYFSMGSFPLLSIPLFIMMGYLADRAGMLPDMVRWLQLILGRTRGGMAYLNVASSMLFAGISGTAVSDVASLGRVEIQLMTRAGYPLIYSAALTAATSIVGPIIPPSIPMVIYALSVGNVSIGGLFLAGAVPGFLLGGGFLAMSWLKARGGNYGVLVDRPSPGEIVRQTLRATPILMLPVVIVGGIVSGIFTVTESAAIGVSCTMLLGFLWTRRLTLRSLYDATVYSAVISSVVGMLLGAGAIVSWILTLNRLTNALADYVTSVSAKPTVFLVMVAVLLFLLGMVMDPIPIIITLAPLLAPIARQYGIDELHFGLVFVLSSLIGVVTPPVGIILFMTASIADISLEALSVALIPFVAWMVAVGALIVLFPGLALWLPRLVGF